MNNAAPRVPDELLVTIGSDQIRVSTIPSNGFDIYSLVDLKTGIDALFKTPWGWRDARYSPPLGTRSGDWLSRYAGGWQLLAPNAGDDTIGDPAVEGFHGEAAIVPWTVTDASASEVTAQVRLMTAPLTLVRTLSVSGRELTVCETILNRSSDPVPFHWVHHPAFTSPFLGDGTRFELDAEWIVPEPGRSGASAESIPQRWPYFTSAHGSFDLSRMPGGDSPREVFATLAGFRTGEYQVINDQIQLGFALAWDLKVFPFAWFWQEVHATQGFPWFKEAYVTALEPSSVIPGRGDAGDLRRGRRLVLSPQGATKTTLVASFFNPGDERATSALARARERATTGSDVGQLTETWPPDLAGTAE